MKKVTSLLAALFVAAGVSFAQSNEASLDQDGDDNSSSIEQAMTSESMADVKQEGDYNSSAIEQVGRNHDASLYNVGNYNSIFQRQRGRENLQRVELWGDDNSFTADQMGRDNFIYLNARGTGPGLFGRAANGGNNNHNTAVINQHHRGNIFSGSVTGSYNNVAADQVGQYNQIGGRFSSSLPAVAPHGIPTGTFGFISSLLNGDAWSGNGVNIYGNDNDVQIEQAGNYNANFAFVEGDANRVVQRMTEGSDNTVIQATNGSDNTSVLELWGDDNMMVTGQKGNGNDLFLNARGTGTGFSGGGGNSSNIFVGLQAGDDNLITAGIDGSYNEIGISQYGSGNAVGTGLYAVDGARVEGDYNTLKIGQFTDNNVTVASMTGNNNSAAITQ